ncbi:MAG: hypothetical protein DMF79_04740, partial [Acidobacteria bacterium]
MTRERDGFTRREFLQVTGVGVAALAGASRALAQVPEVPLPPLPGR